MAKYLSRACRDVLAVMDYARKPERNAGLRSIARSQKPPIPKTAQNHTTAASNVQQESLSPAYS